jgi:hypothetical protein
MNPAYDRIATRANHRCEYCHAPEQAFNLPFEVEHIHPRSRGGSNQDENLALACHSCNLHKGDRTQSIDVESQQDTRFFNPRIDGWDENFDPTDEGDINAKTAIGRVTVKSLNMNASAHVSARKLWIQWKLFP